MTQMNGHAHVRVPVGRKGDWMQTFTGKQFYPLDPRIEDVNIIDIAAALSKQCRYAGHCRQFYSVAEHSVLIYRAAVERKYNKAICFAALMHDAAEAYLVDLPRPVKSDMPIYKEHEDVLLRTIALAFGFPVPLPEQVHQLDDAILRDDLAQNMSRPPADWRLTAVRPLGVSLQCWSPERAFVEFVTAFGEAA